MHSKKMTVLQFLALLLIINPCLSCDNNRPRILNNGSGPEVVNEVLDTIKCSEVFEDDDHSFMRRLAYVETKDGTEGQETTGIWNFTVRHLKSMTNSAVLRNIRLSEANDKICNEISVNVLRAIRNPNEPLDLTNPLVSGVFAQFYLHYVTVVNDTQIPLAENISGQAMFWGKYFKMSADAAMINHFTSRVLELKG